MINNPITLALQAYKRPHYLKRTLDTIRTSVKYALKMDPSLEFILVPSMELDFPEMREVIEEVDFVRCIPYWNERRLGMNQNTLVSYTRAFEYGDVAIEIDEDVDYSEDYLWYAVNMLRKYKGDDSVLHITMYNTNYFDTRVDKVWRMYHAFLCGLITWKDRFEWFKKHWPSPNNDMPSYDVSLWQAFPKDKCGISPIVSRSKHTGVFEGTFAKPEMFTKTPDPLWCGDLEPAIEWEEVPLWKHGEELTNQYQFRAAPGCENMGWDAEEYYNLLHKRDV
jgi:hypothetical protein